MRRAAGAAGLQTRLELCRGWLSRAAHTRPPEAKGEEAFAPGPSSKGFPNAGAGWLAALGCGANVRLAAAACSRKRGAAV